MQSNILFFVFFSIVSVLIVRILPSTWKRIGILFFNILFYGILDLHSLWLIIIAILWSYFWGKYLESKNGLERKVNLVIGIIPIVIILFFFKYYDFFVGGKGDVLQVIMPLGISYYSFKMISYLCDIFRQRRKAESSFINYAVYISFFPQILCGPISKSEEILEKINNLPPPSDMMTAKGIDLVISGLFKKIVIADRLSGYVNCVFADYNSYPAIALWMAAIFFSVQLYCDFSGYSEMAIGISNLLGISCKPNFNVPEFSYSIRDFWNRWHISLSSWLRDYIYIPLGGNRKGKMRKRINILITFLVSGIWHGNTFNYIFWGVWHGMLHLMPIKKAKRKWSYIGQIISTEFFVMLGWVFFKVQSISDGLQYILKMFFKVKISYETLVASILPLTGDHTSIEYLFTIFFLLIVLLCFEYMEFLEKSHGTIFENVRLCVYLGGLILFGVIGQNSFLYANY